MNYNEYEYIIGIDTGVKTGFATYDVKAKKLLTVHTCKIHQAMAQVRSIRDKKIFVRFEDARKRKWLGNKGREVLQGAGSVKRDAKIWEDFLEDLFIPYEAVAPKNNRTKIDAEYFQKITGWNGRTSNHARDAAMLVYGF